MKGLRRAGLLTALLTVLMWRPMVTAEEDRPQETLSRTYQEDVQPLLKRYCYDCHSDPLIEGDVDLAAFDSLDDVRRQTDVWLKVRRMLESGQMPPVEVRQPSERERLQLQKWVRRFLTVEAQKDAGDPGPVVLRRLSNAEYTYTIRDLTGVESLDPTREFPVDGASGEGFTNTGSGKGMSPALVQKYFDAAKEVADHLVLLPDEIGFSPHTSRRDQTDALLERIRSFYDRFTKRGIHKTVTWQGPKVEKEQSGLLPLESHLKATLTERDAVRSGRKSIAEVAREHSLNEKYLGILWDALTADSSAEDSPLMEAFRRRWREAEGDDVGALVAEIADAQKTLWRFNSIGHIGRKGGPKSWMEGMTPVTLRQELSLELPKRPSGEDVVIYLAVGDAGDGNESDFVVWEEPRIQFEWKGTLKSILLRDLRGLTRRIETTIAAEIPRTSQYLEGVAALYSSSESPEEIALSRDLNPGLLERWSELTGLGHRAKREVTGLFEKKLRRVHGYEAVNGWGRNQTPNLLTNRSDEAISFSTLRVPGRGVTVHPSPQQESVVAWRSPFNGKVKIEGLVEDADGNCGNGAAWRVERQSREGLSVLTRGVIDNGTEQKIRLHNEVDVREGDIVSLVVDARDKNHVCDTTHIDFKLSEVEGNEREWNLADDVVDNILAGNPLPDSYGHANVWHFAVAEEKGETDSPIPPGSVLARWRSAVVDSKPVEEIEPLAASVEKILKTGKTSELSEADKELRRRLLDWRGPLSWISISDDRRATLDSEYGLEPARFGKHPDGSALDSADLCLQAPQILKIRLPAGLASNVEFASTAQLHPESGKEGSVQLQMLGEKPESLSVSAASPFLVSADSQAEERLVSSINEFRDLFPPVLCYARIVPVDEVVTLRLYYREDDHLRRLMLNEKQAAELDRLWDELFYVSREPLKLAVAYEQLAEFATQNRPDLVKAFAPLEEPINARADAFRERLKKTEPVHLDAVLDLANRAWRSLLTESEKQELRQLYRRLRENDLSHEKAIRLTVARMLVSPAFLYKLEEPAPGAEAAPVSNYELATRLSYFLWSSLPDEKLRAVAEAGRLTDDEVLVSQTRRMLKDSRTRRLAVQFACQWLHLRGFDKNDGKNEKLYPQFAQLRKDMYQETVRFFEDMFRNDRSVLKMLDADYTFLNEPLAKHYGIEGIEGKEWRRVDGLHADGRGGVLGMASFLAKQSGASRTSPILRGNWVYETLLGKRLPRPPANVPQLPETVPKNLTARELIEQHSSVRACAKCHEKIDPYGFALEQFDAIGRLRSQKVNTQTTLVDGKTIEGFEELRNYLVNERRDEVVDQFCRKLLGYALGREVQLSDEPLLKEMQAKLEVNDFRFSIAVESIVLSPQFREIRGQQAAQNR